MNEGIAQPKTLITPKSWQRICDEQWFHDGEISSALEAVYSAITIYDRLDALISLYEACQKHQPPNKEVYNIQDQMTDFISIIGILITSKRL